MTAYWTCSRCSKKVPKDNKKVARVWINGHPVCRACCKEAIEASKQSAEGGKEKG